MRRFEAVSKTVSGLWVRRGFKSLPLRLLSRIPRRQAGFGRSNDLSRSFGREALSDWPGSDYGLWHVGVGMRLTGRQLVFLVVALGLLVEIPLAFYIFGRNDGGQSVASVGGGVGGVSASLPLHPVAGNFKPDDTTLPECSEQRCFEQAYGNIAYREGAKVAFSLLNQQYGAGADPTCHRITHTIGAATLARNKGNVARTFAEGSSSCWSGYYHGVLERAFSKVKSYDARSLGDKARGLCNTGKVRSSSWLNYQCLHGLGHGLMITTGYRLPLTLDVCKQLTTAFEKTSCKGGVFMENILTSYGGHSPWVRDDDPLYPCNRVAREDKFPCYQNAATRIIRVVGAGDLEKVAQICAEAEDGFVSTCFGSYGQNASVAGFRKPGPILAACAVAKPYGGERECLRYAAMDMTGTFSSGKKAAALCNDAAAELHGGCYEAIGLMLGRLKSTGAGQRRDCRAIAATSSDATHCITGLTLKSSIPGLAR